MLNTDTLIVNEINKNQTFSELVNFEGDIYLDFRSKTETKTECSIILFEDYSIDIILKKNKRKIHINICCFINI
jgi:hypothetical protein